jgi:hypothetical protein
MTSMRRLLLVSVAALGLAPGGFASITFVLNPTIEVYPPGSNIFDCQSGGTAPCVIFAGTLTDTDTDGSLDLIENITVNFVQSAGNTDFTLDTTFFNNVPGVLTGDGVSSDDSYSGPIFGLDFAAGIPDGEYDGTAEITVMNLNSGDTFTEDADFSVFATPEPASVLTTSTGLMGLMALLAIRARRSRLC